MRRRLMTEQTPIECRRLPVPLLTRDPRVLDLPWADRGVLAALFAIVDADGVHSARLDDLAPRLQWRDPLRRLSVALARLQAAGLIQRFGLRAKRELRITNYRALVADERGAK
jgi:hypothetical protein